MYPKPRNRYAFWEQPAGVQPGFFQRYAQFCKSLCSPAPSPLTPLPPATTFSRYINPACRCAFPLLLSKYIGPPMNHAWPRWKPTFGCKKEKSSLFPKKNIAAKQAELKEFVKLMCCVFRFFFLFFFFIYLLFSDSSLFIVQTVVIE